MERGDQAKTVRSLVVLPLESFSGDPSHEFLADALTDDLITSLSVLPGLRVISRTSAMQYKGARRPLAEIAAELDVQVAIEGTVLRERDRVRVSAKLIDAMEERNLWAGKFDRELESILELVTDIAHAIAERVERELRASAAEPPARTVRTAVNIQAYEALIEGKHLLSQRTPETLRRAVDVLERVVELDPDNVRGHEGLAMAWALMDNYSVLPSADAIPRALEAGDRALALDPDSSVGLLLRGGFDYAYGIDYERAEEQLTRATEQDPGNATVWQWLGDTYATWCRIDDAVRAHERARNLDPLSRVVNAELGFWGYFCAGRLAEAEARLCDCRRLDPAFVPGRVYLAVFYAALGRHDEARIEVDAALAHGRDLHWAWLAHAFAAGRRGDRAEAELVIERFLSEASQRFVNPSLVAGAYAGIRDVDGAVEWISRCENVRSLSFAPFASSPVWWPALRDEPRFHAVLANYHVEQSADARRVAEHVAALGAAGGRASPPQTVVPSEPGDARPRGLFRREGEYWTLEFADRVARIKHSRGMDSLAPLLLEPDREIAALDLFRGAADPGVASGAANTAATDGLEGDAGELIDERARAQYAERLRDVRQALEEAESWSDLGRAEALREEIDFLDRELRRAVGLGGRVRKAGDPGERARVNVTKAIRTAIARIASAHRDLGEHLERAISTGRSCSYRPEPDDRIDWLV